MKASLLSFLLLVCGRVQSFVVPVEQRAKSPVHFWRQRHGDHSLLRTVSLETNDVVLFTEETTEPDSEHFNWFKAWYPLVPVEILDTEKPHRFELLGQDIVVWNDGPVKGYEKFGSKKNRPRGAQRVEGTWRAFVDQCPHRKVPLSEGRVEDDGTLLCSYHAWRFNGDGSCVAIPQLSEQGDSLERIKSNPKSSCNSFPTKVINGVLFVWPSSDENAVLESELNPVAHRPAAEDKTNVWEGPWNYRELPYGADWFLENVVDPAHVSVSHHNVVGSRYDSQEMNVEMEKTLKKDGFSVRTSSPLNPNSGTTEFIAPSLVAIDAPVGDSEDGGMQTLELYVSPSRPGFSNHIGRMVIRKGKDGKMPALLKQFTLPLPKWLNHILASAFLNQDALFLHHQERTMAATGQYKTVLDDGEEPFNYNKAVYPINSDKGVITFRNWLRQFAGGRIPYKNKQSMPSASNEVVFDVWNAHTKHCRYCLTALSRLKKARFASFAAATVFGVLRPFGRLGSLASTSALVGAGLVLHKLIGMFYRYEFSHAHND